tara:strand:- start:782 stop:1078 length:297 start_codon:yes stop_codon:yes gene_type:complete
MPDPVLDSVPAMALPRGEMNVLFVEESIDEGFVEFLANDGSSRGCNLRSSDRIRVGGADLLPLRLLLLVLFGCSIYGYCCCCIVGQYVYKMVTAECDI